MTVTDRPTLPLDSYPGRGPRGSAPAEPDGALRIVRRILCGIVLTLVVFVVLARVGVQVTGLWSPAPDTDAFDDVVHAAGLEEGPRTAQSGSPAFGHPASVGFSLAGPRGGGAPTCSALYRAASVAGWTSADGVDAGSCTGRDGVDGSRSDTLTGPDGDEVQLSWYPPYDAVEAHVEESLDPA